MTEILWFRLLNPNGSCQLLPRTTCLVLVNCLEGLLLPSATINWPARHDLVVDWDVKLQHKQTQNFSQKLWGLECWNLVHTWTVGRCFVYSGIGLLLLICPFIFHFSLFVSLFIFLSLQFSNIKSFRHTFLRRIFRHTFLSWVVGLRDATG